MGLDAIPLPLFFLGTILIVLLSLEAGYRLGIRSHRLSPDEKESMVSAVSGTVLGLVAFMLAFTFSMVSNRYDTRKGLVRDEANAIGTAYLRTDFLAEPDQTESRALYKRYIEHRLAANESGVLQTNKMDEVLAVAERIQTRLWELAVANARKDLNSDIGALYIEALNEVIDIHALRVAVGVQARIPIVLWVVLFCITVLGMMSMGYQAGISASKRSAATGMLAVSFALVIVLIASLDRPRGIIRVTQQPLIDLHKSILEREQLSPGAP